MYRPKSSQSIFDMYIGIRKIRNLSEYYFQVPWDLVNR